LGTVEQSIAGYFHQDWDLDGDDDGEVIGSFVEGESMEHVQEVGCAFRHQADGYSGAEWLNSVVFGFAA
jgi:hypothetical protein